MCRLYSLFLLSLMLLSSCFSSETFAPAAGDDDSSLMENDSTLMDTETGCPGYDYPALDSTPYVLPFPVGQIVPTGLANCSYSFHAADRGDALAFDFDMPYESAFTAIRAGWVTKVVEDQDSFGGDGAGNYVVINHGDRTYGLYYHSPFDGILVEEGERVRQGQELGLVGRSGYAGYTHLHLIVVANNYAWPYIGVPISFKNVYPPHRVLQSGFRDGYEALPY